MSTICVGTWNTQWAKPETQRGQNVSAALAGPDCDVLCVTEGYADILPDGGHVIDAGTDWGYPVVKDRRKVLLWSKRPWSEPWSDIDPAKSSWIPGGRFIAATTETDVGPIVVIGVCIPWSGAHVNSGRRDRKLWQDHEYWLSGFERRDYRRTAERTLVLGDFNQRIPRQFRSPTPKRMYELLQRTFAGFTFATAGKLSGAPGQAIDHIAITPDLELIGDIGIWPKQTEKKKNLSDHFGVWGNLKLSSTDSKSK